jgi:hypothetical protein
MKKATAALSRYWPVEAADHGQGHECVEPRPAAQQVAARRRHERPAEKGHGEHGGHGREEGLLPQPAGDERADEERAAGERGGDLGPQRPVEFDLRGRR